MVELLVPVFFCLIFSFWFSASFAPICIYLAKKFNIVDVPDGKIKVHKQPTPYLGGLVVFFGLLVGSVLFLQPSFFAVTLLVLFALILLLGLLDDLFFLHPGVKCLGMALYAVLFLFAIIYFKGLGDYFWLKLFVYFVWMLSITNALNLIDIMDGLATITLFFPTSFFLVVAILQGNYLVAILLSAFIGGLLGFFIFNLPPARMYLGDAGSLFLGGFISGIPLLLNWESFGIIGYSMPVIVLGIPCLEVLGLIIIRTYKKLPFYLGSPDHFAIYLKNKGWTNWGVLLFVSILSLVEIITVSYFVMYNFSLVGIILSGWWFLVVWLFALFHR